VSRAFEAAIGGALDGPRLPGVDAWFYDYFSFLRTPRDREAYVAALRADLEIAGIPDPVRLRVLDAGAGFGVTAYLLALLGARPVALDLFPPMLRSGRCVLESLPGGAGVPFVRGRSDALPFPDRTFDFIYVNEAISHFRQPDRFLREGARALAPGGAILVSDGNNPENPIARRHAETLWRAFEEGPGNRIVGGHEVGTPYVERRKEMLRARRPGLPEETLTRLAWGTFGLAGEEIHREAEARLARGDLPLVPPAIASAPVDPAKGDCIEALVSPWRLASVARDAGLRARVLSHFGGARYPLLRPLNRLLRPSLFLPLARGFRVLARKP
jgi:ubiquinone/menaquinone biosynthesis C-methylase UbiE